MELQLIWAPHPTEGYALARVVDIRSNETALVRFEASARSSRKSSSNNNNNNEIECSLSQVFPTEVDIGRDHADNCSLMYLNEANLLNNIRLRYCKDEIYVS